ncbi:C-8 acyltransferase [Ilyonectria destructans]|nr:C-8 acyltransferase [Ilyonectria destructans]
MEDKILSAWNQIAPRAYVRLWYCLPYQQHASLDALREHLTLVLSKLVNHFPDLGGRLYLLANPAGRLSIRVDGNAEIPLKIFDQRDSFGWTYSEFKSQGFPAKALVDKSFDLPYQLIEGELGAPILEIHARVIEGGLLLGIYSHHSISDGSGMNNFIRPFAELTRDPARTLNVRYPTDFHIDLPENVHHQAQLKLTSDANQLLRDCPEYCRLPSPTGPTQFHMPEIGTPWDQIQKTGCIFVIGDEKISSLKQSLANASSADSQGRPLSTFTCLAAITWVHVIKARLSSPVNLLALSSKPKTLPNKARLLISVNWRRRAFSRIVGASAGNTVALPIMSIDTPTIMAACGSDQNAAIAALADVTRTIDGAISGVNEDFVALRTRLIRESPDPRLIGVNVDPRDPSAFYFNTWRYFGAQTRWKLPGLVDQEGSDGVAPDALRRAQGDWNLGAGLVLPAGKDSTKYEVLVTLEIASMEVLCADPSWIQWVEKVVT